MKDDSGCKWCVWMWSWDLVFLGWKIMKMMSLMWVQIDHV